LTWDKALEGLEREAALQTGMPLYQDLLSIAWRHKLLIALGAVLGLALGWLDYAHRIPVYRSDAQVLVIKKRPDALPVTGVEGWPSYFEDYLAGHQTLIKSPLIIGKALQRPELQGLKSFAGSADPTSLLIDSLAISRDLQETGGQSNVLRLSFRGGVAEECATVLRAVIDGYKDFLDETYKNVSNDTLELITKARDVLQKDLAEKEAAYSAFRQKSPLLWKGKEGANLHQERLARIESQRSNLLVRRTEIQGRLRAIENLVKRGLSRSQLLAMLPQVPAKTETDGARRLLSGSLEEQLLPLLQQEQTLLEDFGSNHPHVQAVRRRIELTRKLFALSSMWQDDKGENAGLLDPAEFYVQSLKQELNQMQMSEQLLNELFKNEYDEARRLANYEIQEEALRGDIARSHQLYDGIIKRLQEINLIRDFGGYDARTISPATNGHKIEPKPFSIFPAVLLGVLGGFGLAYLADRATKSFRTPEEIRRRLGLPILGQIPLITSAKQALPGLDFEHLALDPFLCTHYQPQSKGAESYRGLRTALFHSMQDNNHVIQITSPDRADGKTTLVGNLGISIAQSGKSVILIDADLRKPRLHKLFGLSAPVGLASILQGQAELGDGTQRSSVPGLSILPCGPIPPNPAELLTSPCFKKLLKGIREQYDFVLVDTSPLLAVADPCIVALCVEAVLLTVPVSKNSRPHAERAKEILETLDINVLGIVVNRVDLHTGAGRYDGYAYAYYGDANLQL